MRPIAIAAAACVILTGCMVGEQDLSGVKAAVVTFHERQAAGQDELIYSESTQVMRAAATQDNLTRLNTVVRAALPNCPPAPPEPEGFRWFAGTGGTTVTVQYSRACSTGDLTEQFVFRLENGAAKLEGYNVQGMALFPATPAATTDTATAGATTTGTTAAAPSTSATTTTAPTPAPN